MLGKPTMNPAEERAWVSMAQDGSLRRWANGLSTQEYDLEYEAVLKKRARLLAS